MKQFALITSLLALACTALCASAIAATNEITAVVPYDEATEASAAPYIIFNNLENTPGNRYDLDDFVAKTIAGKRVDGGQTEKWYAIRFSPKVDVQATVISAAIGYISGTRLIKLGLYNNDELFQTVGDPLPGGTGSTTQIPDLGECCKLASVTLKGQGVTLKKSEIYWLVAAPDNTNGPDFLGGWYVSNLGNSAQDGPPDPWDSQVGGWPAAQIRGTRLQTLQLADRDNVKTPSTEVIAPSGKAIIFSNLGRAYNQPYLPGIGVQVAGKDIYGFEFWRAIPFTPRADMHATTLVAAIGYVGGGQTGRVNLAIYSDSAGLPGELLQGGQGSTDDIPQSGDCCDLTKVSLPKPGVALSAGVRYWLVASPGADNFLGLWQDTSLSLDAVREPEDDSGWRSFTGEYLAAEIRGTNP